MASFGSFCFFFFSSLYAHFILCGQISLRWLDQWCGGLGLVLGGQISGEVALDQCLGGRIGGGSVFCCRIGGGVAGSVVDQCFVVESVVGWLWIGFGWPN